MENIKYIPGDLVKYENKLAKVYKKTSFDEVALYSIVTGEDGMIGAMLEDDFSPIPLTEEILEKNGWEKDELDVYFKRIGITFIFLSKLSNGDWSVCLSKSKLINCKHVHQLQHLLFGLGLNHKIKV